MKILVLNGPNLNMLGIRQPEIYGRESYQDLCKKIENYGKSRQIDLSVRQSNYEGELVTWIQEAYRKFDGIVINPGAYTHTSIAIPDAVSAVGIPTVEVHISDPDQREDFRKINYLRPVVTATVKGKGTDGYLEALDILCKRG